MIGFLVVFKEFEMITDIPSVWGGHLDVRVLATAGEYVLLRCALD